jgi:BirA family biotin operon repressor/biotin-[acetyl-CoA-carboxylase] ligase
MDAHLIERDLKTQRVGRNAIVFDAVDSTNDVAADTARQDGADGLVVLAEHQRRGRGRLGRTWLSPPRQNVLMSVLLLDTRGAVHVEALTIAAGLAVAEGVDAACGSVTCELRWPNDVLVAGAKVAGVLVERRQGADGGVVIVGIGVNANAAPAADEVDRPATSLAEQTGGPVERIELVRAVLRRLDHWVAQLSTGRLGPLHEAWVARCGMINQRVTVRAAGGTHVGRVLDVSPLEGLVLAGDDGQRVHLPAAEATLVD